ncbi:BT4734/BF3469 family protein [Chryseobacterium terrae]|uniref:BT4734/BF3469 family protein n=1 Tax=Chryseobacterium terrae TaxID=3163299 RepID=A0ABW8Y6J6_9FLAO
MFRKFTDVKTNYSNTTFENIQEVINHIKDNSRPELKKINKLRVLKKGQPEFDLIKSQLPIILWNFTTDGGRKIMNSLKSTGYIYYDIDNNTDFQFNKDYFTAHWRSVSGTGYGCLIKVSGVDKNNFKEAFTDIAKQLGIPFDYKAGDIVRANILSYDPNIYYNPNAHSFDCTCYSSTNSEDIEENLHSINKDKLFNSYVWNGEKCPIQYDNLQEKISAKERAYDENGVCDLKDDKLYYSRAVIPKTIQIGTRNRILSSIAIRILALNPELPDYRLTKFISKVNNSCCTIPMEDDEIKTICSTVLRKRHNLIPLNNEKRRFLFDPQKEFQKGEKQRLAITYLNKCRGERIKQVISHAFSDLLNECRRFKIKDILEMTKVSQTTINKHLPLILMEEYKNEVEDIQQFFNAKKQMQKLLNSYK